MEGDWSWSGWKGLKALDNHNKITCMSCLALFVSVVYVLSTQALEEFLAQEEGWMALRFSTRKWKVQLRIVVMQNYVGIPAKSEITLVNVLVSWHPIPSVYSSSCLLKAPRCHQLQVTSCKGAEPPCFSLFFGTVLQITHGDFLEVFTEVTEIMPCPWYRWDWWNHQETSMPWLTCHHIRDENGSYLLPEGHGWFCCPDVGVWLTAQCRRSRA